MDGLELLYRLRQVLEEDSSSSFMDDKTSYSFLWEAAEDLVDITGCLTTTQDITTVADQTDYTLNSDFLRLYLKDKSNRFYVKHTDADGSVTFIYHKDYEDIIYSNQTTSVTVPSHFAITDDAIDDRISNTTGAVAATKSGGEVTLTDTTNTPFADVSAGDTIHNVTDGSDGVVLSKTSTSVITVALFGGTDDEFDTGDDYVIQPQGRLKIVLDPPPETAGETLTIYYIQRPAPVFSDYGIYRFPQKFSTALIKYAAWLYKFRDSEPDYGNVWYKYWDRSLRLSNRSVNNSNLRKGFKVNFRKRA